MKLCTVNVLTKDNNILVVNEFFGAATVEEALFAYNKTLAFTTRTWLRNFTRKMFSALDLYDILKHSI